MKPLVLVATLLLPSFQTMGQDVFWADFNTSARVSGLPGAPLIAADANATAANLNAGTSLGIWSLLSTGTPGAVVSDSTGGDLAFLFDEGISGSSASTTRGQLSHPADLASGQGIEFSVDLYAASEGNGNRGICLSLSDSSGANAYLVSFDLDLAKNFDWIDSSGVVNAGGLDGDGQGGLSTSLGPNTAALSPAVDKHLAQSSGSMIRLTITIPSKVAAGGSNTTSAGSSGAFASIDWDGDGEIDTVDGDVSLQPFGPRNTGITEIASFELFFDGDPTRGVWIDNLSATIPAITVTTDEDEDDGSMNPALGEGTSLREVINHAPEYSIIDFALDQAGQIAVIDMGPLVIDQSLTIDGSSLSTAFIIDARSKSRVFTITSGTTAILDSLTIKGGLANDGSLGQDGGHGGGIHNSGTLTLHRTTLSDNDAGDGGDTNGSGGGRGGDGGGIYNLGTLTVKNSTIAENSTGSGGDVDETGGGGGLAGDSGNGGGICNLGTLNIISSTISDNSAARGGDGDDEGSGDGADGIGGGIYTDAGGATAWLHNAIVADNFAVQAPDLYAGVAPITVTGASLFSDLSDSSLTASSTVIEGEAYLAPLGDYGGLTQTMAPLPGSPAIDAARSTTVLTDQRNVPRASAIFNTDFSSTLGGGVVLGSAQLDGGSVQLTSGGTVEIGSLILPPTLGQLDALSASFDFLFSVPSPGAIGEGLSFNLAPTPSTPYSEQGADSGLVVVFATAPNSDFQVKLDGATIATYPTNASLDAGSSIPITIVLTREGLLSATWNGVTVFDDVATGYLPDPDYVVSFGSQTGPGSSEHRLDNINLVANPIGRAPDLGSVESGNTIPDFVPMVTDTADIVNDTGATQLSLREAIAFSSPGQTITFHPSLDGQTIIITGGEYLIDKSIKIDASSLPNGITLDANGVATEHRLLKVAPSINVTLDSLTLTGGVTEGGAIGFNGTNGGGILNHGELTLVRCLVTGNETGSGGDGLKGNGDGSHGGDGGGIYNLGFLTLRESTFSHNFTGAGGDGAAEDADPGDDGGNGGRGAAIFNTGSIVMENCTIAQNQTGLGGCSLESVKGRGGDGAGIYNQGTIKIVHSTIAENKTGNGLDGLGGGICNDDGTVSMLNVIVTDNEASPSAPDVMNTTLGEITASGQNLVSDLSNSGLEGNQFVTVSGALLAPLGSYGGPTPTMPPLPGSQAIDQGGATALTTDQRGLSRGTASFSQEFTEALTQASTLSAKGPDPSPLLDPTTATIDNNGFLLTPAVANQEAALLLPSLGQIDSALLAFDYTFSNPYLPATAPLPGEGFSINLGDSPSLPYTQSAITEGLVIEFKLAEANGDPTKGDLVVHDITNAQTLVTAIDVIDSVAEAAENSPTAIPITLALDSKGLLTVTWNNVVVVEALPTAYTPDPSHLFSLTARTGSDYSEQRLDNLTVLTNTMGDAPDLGAVEAGGLIPGFSPIVTETSDDVDGLESVSLREALAFASLGDSITFHPSLDGASIALTNGQLNLDRSLTIDASALLQGLTIDASEATTPQRHFEVADDISVVFDSLTLAGGQTNAGEDGGSILNHGDLTILRSTLHTNSTGAGGSGGAISNEGPATLAITKSTLAGNATGSGGLGGAIHSTGAITLAQTTISGNSASDGGGLSQIGSSLSLTNTILAGNSASNTAPDFQATGGPSVTTIGVNLLKDLTGNGLAPDSTVIIGDAHLAPLGHYGGPTLTMPPRSGSPALDAAGPTDPGGTDQRGAPRFVDGDDDTIAALDIGAIEFQPTVVTTAADESQEPEGSTLSLREALARSYRSTITFDSSVNGSSVSMVLGPLVIAGSAILDASSLSKGLTLDGGGSDRLFEVLAGNHLSLDTLTLSNGAAIDGGAILNAGDLTINRSTLTHNVAQNDGGAIFNQVGATLSLTHTTLSENRADNDGGAFYHTSGSTPSVTSSTISRNSAGNQGGGLASLTEGVSLENSIVAGNAASTSANIQGTSATAGLNITSGDPRLAPLAFYGGPTQTMPPLVDSPAIDPVGGATTTASLADQRSFSRLVDGDDNASVILDIGAVEAGPVFPVLNTNDAAAGSLRQALIDAVSISGARVVFSSATFPDTITLTSGVLPLAPSTSIFIDATDLAGGVTLNGAGSTRIFQVPPNASLGLANLILTGGFGDSGGAISIDQGVLSMSATSLAANTATIDGGAISAGLGSIVAVQDSTLNGNSAGGDGGAIASSGASLFLRNATLALNSATGTGGALFNDGPAAHAHVESSTLSQNLASDAQGSGGISNSNGASTTIAHSIVSGNTRGSPAAPSDLGNTGFTVQGTNLIAVSASPPAGGGMILAADPELLVLGDYGGSTQTMPPLPVSPALDGAPDQSILTWDQRGRPRPSGPAADIGAVELQEMQVTTAVDENDGIASGGISLREALAHSVAGEAEVIRFDQTLSGTTLILGTPRLSVDRNVTIDAFSLPNGFTISGDNAQGIFSIAPSTTALLRGLTLSEASNTAVKVLASATLHIDQCTLYGNSSDLSGGGALQALNAVLKITNSTLANNTALSSNGGALSLDNSLTTLAHVTISGNSCDLSGGGIYQSAGTLTVQNSIVAVNSGGTANIETTGGTTTYLDQNLTTGDPDLSPLGDYGGPTWSMIPSFDSPVVDAGSSSEISIDQRGMPRDSDHLPDLGAVENQREVVTTLVDENDGPEVNGVSLREAIALALSGSSIVFDGSLDGDKIVLTEGQLSIDKDLTLDARALVDGLTIGANGQSRLLEIDIGTNVTLYNLILTEGRAPNGTNGGGIYNAGELSLLSSTISGNTTGMGGIVPSAQGGTFGGGGGGIYNSGTLTLYNTTVSDNTTANGSQPGYGGGIYNMGSATLTIENSTLAQNSTNGFGGGIYNASAAFVTVLASTIADNQTGSTGNGGGIYNGGGDLILNNSIIANNRAPSSAPDLRQGPTGSITPFGVNLLSDLDHSGLVDDANTNVGQAFLAPLGDFGGFTATMPPIPGSPAIDADGTSSPVSLDQRGLPRPIGAAVDIGSVEYQGTTEGNTILSQIWDLDSDGDGNSYGLELALGTDYQTPDPGHPGNLSMSGPGAGNKLFQFGLNPNAEANVIWVLKRSTDLTPGSFTEIYRYEGPTMLETLGPNITAAGTATQFEITDENPPAGSAYYRLEAEFVPIQP